MAKKKTPAKLLEVTVPTQTIQVPDIEPGELLTQAQHEAWTLWAREVINCEDVEAEVEPEVLVAFLQWRRLMNNRAFCLVPMNSAEFRDSLAGRLPPNERRRIVQMAGVTMVEAMQLSFPEIVNAARRTVLVAKSAVKKTPANPWTPDEETEARRLITAGTVNTATALQEMLSMNRTAAQSLYRMITRSKRSIEPTDFGSVVQELRNLLNSKYDPNLTDMQTTLSCLTVISGDFYDRHRS